MVAHRLTREEKAVRNAARQREWRARQADLRDALRVAGIEDPVKTFARIAESPESYAARYKAIRTPVWGWTEAVELAFLESGYDLPTSQDEADAFADQLTY